MSYILDALKKSEKERRRGAAPDIMTVHDLAAEKVVSRPFWPYLLVIVLLLNAVIVALWLSPGKSKKGDAITQTTVTKFSDVTTPEAKKGSDVLSTSAERDESANVETGTAKNETQKVKVRSTDRVTPPVQKWEGKKAESVARPQDRPINEPSSAVSRQTLDTPPLPKPQQEINERPEPGRIYNLKELPQSIHQVLPAFAISVYLYSPDPAGRMVRINGQAMREGQTLSEGLRLEEISPDAVIFNYKDFRFRVGPK